MWIVNDVNYSDPILKLCAWNIQMINVVTKCLILKDADCVLCIIVSMLLGSALGPPSKIRSAASCRQGAVRSLQTARGEEDCQPTDRTESEAIDPKYCMRGKK